MDDDKQPAIAPTWSVAGYYFCNLLDTFDALGGDSDRLLEKACPGRASRYERERHYPLAQLLRLYRLAADECQEPDLGLHCVMQDAVDAFGLLGAIAKSAGTLREAWESILRYRQLMMNLGRSRIVDEAGLVSLSWYPYSHDIVTERYFVDAVVAAWIIRSSALADTDISPVEVRLTYPAPERLTPLFQQIYGTNVAFSQAFNSIRFQREDFERPLRYRNRTIFETLSARAELDVKSHIREYSVVESLESYLQPRLSTMERPISMEAAARALHLSPRTLQRRLKSANTSFNQLLVNVRHNFALHYLQDSRLSITEISLRLGYSQSSSFCTAFKSWTGQSPREYQDSQNNQ